MRIACPYCPATYEVPDEMLGTGPRTLRCARCGKEWTQPALPLAVAPDPPAPASAAKPPVAKRARAPAIVAVREGAATLGIGVAKPPHKPPLAPQRKPAGLVNRGAKPPPSPYAEALAEAEKDLAFRRPPATAAWVGWAASIVVLGVLIWAGYNFRAGVMHAWPPSQRLYTTLGLASQPGHAPSAATHDP